MEISSLVETASKTLAPKKSQMRALLSQWEVLAKQEKGDPAYQQSLAKALRILEKSSTTAEMITKLKQSEAR